MQKEILDQKIIAKSASSGHLMI